MPRPLALTYVDLMTSAQPTVATQASLDVAIHRLDELTAELLVLRDQMAGAELLELPPTAAALDRAIDGVARHGDVQLLGPALHGARLIVLDTPSGSGALLERQLLANHSHIVLRRAAHLLLVLVRDLPRRADDDRGRRAAASVAAAALRESDVVVGISSPMIDATQLPAAYGEARDAALLARRAGLRCMFADEQWAQLGIARLAQEAARCLTIANPLARLAEYDDEHGCDLTGTVGAWLVNNCETSGTASALALHPNTLRYRLRRAQEVAGIDLDDPASRLLAHLLLQVAPLGGVAQKEGQR
jgi:sugar diacid utilization regulator